MVGVKRIEPRFVNIQDMVIIELEHVLDADRDNSVSGAVVVVCEPCSPVALAAGVEGQHGWVESRCRLFLAKLHVEQTICGMSGLYSPVYEYVQWHCR